MDKPILEVKNAIKTFGGLIAVNNVSFTVSPGEIFGVAGPNGSGKSTLFNLITGIPYKPTSGEVWFDGSRIERWPAHRISRAGLCRTFQKDTDFAGLDANETVLVGAVYNGDCTRNECVKHVQETLDLVLFPKARREMRSSELSVYERKQLMIASALVSKPKVLMLDEPASGLSRPETAELENLLITINKNGITIVIIEHVLSLLLSVSQRLMVLNEGSVLVEGHPEEVIKNNQVVEAYIGSRKV